MPSHWYLLRTKPHKEQLVCHILRARGLRVFAPAAQATPLTEWAANLQACFACYLFVRLNPEERSVRALNWVPGAQTLVELAGEPVTVPGQLLAGLQAALGEAGENGERETGREVEGVEELLALLGA